jgi:hypothetical protein
MDQQLCEFVHNDAARLRVDRKSGVIRGVKILGLASRNGRRYLPEALARAASLYEGAKVNVNHAKGATAAARDYQDRLGFVRGVAMREGEGLFGDLHFNPAHAVAGQLIWDAENAPQNVGLSHNVMAHVARRGDETVVEAITAVQSVDLVADPATTAGLFEASAVDRALAEDEPPAIDLKAATLEQLQEIRPDLVTAVRERVAPEGAALARQVGDLARQVAALQSGTTRIVAREQRTIEGRGEASDAASFVRAIT